MPPIFTSRDRAYRDPFGAVADKTPVHFRLCVPREWGCSAAYLRMREEGRLERFDGMFWAGMADDEHEWWECHFAPDEPGLYWYDFVLDTRDGRRLLRRLPDGSAQAVYDPDARCEWQLTCYERGFTTPDWLVGGVMYQVFPDRFCRSGASKEGVPKDRVLHERWGEEPVWQPNEQGRILNNDYFGGDLRGIEQRLDYLAALGVTCLYINPVFEAHSNHRYDTADYEKIDPLLGSEEDFRSLARSAAQVGIRLLLDGVFSHTGADSRYFNKSHRYAEEGAYNSPSSPYYPWYHFTRWPQEYAGWWGFDTLPEVDEQNPSFDAFINGADGVVRQWLRRGASGWRLDVADELPDGFLEELRRAAKAEKPDCLVLGEVWEDASTKQSYGHRRRYLLGRQLDSVMNYPFRAAILGFLTGGRADDCLHTVYDIVEHYPPQVTRLLMNHIGTHDTERALTLLAGEATNGRGRQWQAAQRLSPEARARGLRLLRLAAALQYCLPGVPCVYYGDEAGMEGYRDPFNRGCYPWGEEDRELVRWYRKLGQFRKAAAALREGDFSPVFSSEEVVCFERLSPDGAVLCAVNRAQTEREVRLPPQWHGYTVAIGGGRIVGDALTLPGLDCALLLHNRRNL